MSILAVVDADKIQDYVFSPHELRLVRGGSALQSIINMEELPSLAEHWSGQVVYAGGGTTLVSFDSGENAQGFCAAAERRYADLTLIATATSASMSHATMGFAEVRDRLFGLLERRKNARNAHDRPVSSPFAEVCGACGQYPAALQDPAPERARRICLACRQRLVYADRSKLLLGDRQPAEDLSAVGKVAHPLGYIATVHIDLDRAGAFLKEHAGTVVQYRELSGTMRDSVTMAVHAALEHAVPTPDCSEVRYEVFLLGGDDAVVALPANRFFSFLEKFQEVYHHAWNLNPHPSFSVGALLTQAHTPIASMLRQAEQLLRSAKRMPRTNQGGLDLNNDAVDYCISSGSVADDVLQERDDVATRGNSRLRTMKPYTISEALALASGVSRLRKADAPANKIRSLFDIAHQPLQQADLEYLFVLSRLEPGHRRALRRMVEGVEPTQTVWRPVRPGADEATCLADIAELWEFCR